MVQKQRGRPRAFDAETASRQAMERFWDQGFSATSLDDLSAATGMNRPSIYGAFGDKKSFYLKILADYEALGADLIEEKLAAPSLRQALSNFFHDAVDFYLRGEHGGRGCMLTCTAAVESVRDSEIQSALRKALAHYDDQLAARLRLAVKQGELSAQADIEGLARLASAMIHSFAIRARAGDDRADLERTAATALETVLRAWAPGAL